jgi:hypothetical protein
MPAPDDRRNQMLDLARRWRDSGATARAFAQEHGVTPWTLYYWRDRLAKPDRPKRRSRRAPRVKLAPVRLVAPAADKGGDVEVILVSGDRVRMSTAVSAETLRCVIQVLRTGC